MENNTSIQAIQEQYKNCNLLMPTSTEVQLNPFYKLTVQSVTVDTSENSGDIFEVGNRKQGDTYIPLYSLAKPFLMKLANAAGIQIDHENSYGTYINKNCYKAKAFGAMMLPDGSCRTFYDEKVINLDDEEDKFRLEFMDKAIKGIPDEKAAKEAEKMFPGGEWFKTVNKYSKACMAYKVPEKHRQAYVERAVLVNMTLLRKTFAEKAMTGARLRVIRALLGLKGAYTLEELKKPFAVAKATFTPNFNNPEERNLMFVQGLNSMSNMFGTASIPVIGTGKSEVIDTSFNPEEYQDNSAFVSDATESPEFIVSDETEKGAKEEKAVEAPVGFYCSRCNSKMTDTVYHYSMNNYGRPLCMSCQNKGVR